MLVRANNEPLFLLSWNETCGVSLVRKLLQRLRRDVVGLSDTAYCSPHLSRSWW